MLEVILAIMVLPWLLFWILAGLGAVILLIAIGYYINEGVRALKRLFNKDK